MDSFEKASVSKIFFKKCSMNDNFPYIPEVAWLLPPPLDEKLLVFTRGGGNYQAPQKYFFGTKIPKYFVFFKLFPEIFFFVFFFRFVFLLQKLVTFWDKKFKNIFSFLKNIFQNLFLQKNIFLNLCAQKVTKFCSNKKMKKNIFMQKQFWKIFF